MHTNEPEPRSKKKQKKTKKHSNVRWIVTIFFVAVLISSAISFLSSSVMEDAGIVEAFVVLLLIVLIGILFDVVGVAVMSAGEKPFHSMAAKKVPGAAEALMLLRNAEKVSSFCNDVVGDICGVVSGSASATIASQILTHFTFSWPQVVSLVMSALAAALTVGGKAIGKTFAIRSCTAIVHSVGRLIYTWNHFRMLFRKKKES